MRTAGSRFAFGLVMLLFTAAVQGEQIIVGASRDNTIFSESNNSAGGGGSVFAGRTNEGNIRRALLHFDVAGMVPTSATVTDVALTLHLERASSSETQATVLGLYRLAGDWGEGVSGAGAGGGGGGGSTPTLDDATWTYSDFDTVLWSVPGGDFADTPSAEASVGAEVDYYQWSSTPELVADVQGWLDDPASNFGWALLGGESRDGSARRFNSREAAEIFRPALLVEFTAVPEPSAMFLLAFASLVAALHGRARRIFAARRHLN